VVSTIVGKTNLCRKSSIQSINERIGIEVPKTPKNNMPKSPDVLIIIATDKEFCVFDKQIRIEFTMLPHKINIGKGRETTEIQVYYFVISKYEKVCAYACLNEKGWEQMEHFSFGLIRALRPRFITTYGTCAGAEEHLLHTIFFSGAKFQSTEDGTIQVRDVVNLSCVPIETWRRSSHSLKMLRPKYNTYVFTSRSEEAENTPVVPILKEHDVVGVDMEIACIWEQLQRWNSRHRDQCTPLAAVKAVSDTGNKQERDLNTAQALKNAYNALIAYLTYLAEISLI